jgi:Protein of unknown function (DUF1573)
MWKQLGLATAIIAGGCSRANGPARIVLGPSVPRVTIEPPVVDLGAIEVDQRASKSTEFKILNRGSGKLEITAREVSCGCTVLEAPPQVVPPAGSATVRLVVNARNESGTHVSFVTLHTNDPQTPVARVPVRWSEHYAIALAPRTVDFGWIATGKCAESVVDVILSPRLINTALQVRCTDNLVSSGWVDKAFVATRRSDGFVARKLKITLKNTLKEGNGVAELRVLSADGKYLSSLPITWRAGPVFEGSPRAFFESAVKPGAKLQKRLIVTSADGSRFRVKRVQTDGRDTAFTSKPIRGANRQSQFVTFVVSCGAAAGTERHEICVSLAGDRTGSVTVPMTLLIR